MNKLNELIDWFEDKTKVMIALSGGVDSALVAYAAFQKLGNSAIAVTADYKGSTNQTLRDLKIHGTVYKPFKIEEIISLVNN